MRKTSRIDLALAACGLLALATSACRPAPAVHWQGYLEAEYVYVAAPVPGQLEALAVTRGDRVEAGAPLFTLESAAEQAAQREAASRAAAARARVADLQQGLRPSELAALTSRLEQARAAAELSRLELARQEQLHASGVNSAETYDRARLTHERNLNAVDELAAQVETARLGGR
ncbi:MAG: biotin/lipoyl-binding protein, partial [Cephaloticoccus sp.]